MAEPHQRYRPVFHSGPKSRSYTELNELGIPRTMESEKKLPVLIAIHLLRGNLQASPVEHPANPVFVFQAFHFYHLIERSNKEDGLVDGLDRMKQREGSSKWNPARVKKFSREVRGCRKQRANPGRVPRRRRILRDRRQSIPAWQMVLESAASIQGKFRLRPTLDRCALGSPITEDARREV
jgi:hypothetical protein